MGDLSVGIILVILAAASALPLDQVISKTDPGPRYQYMSGPHGPELVDLWLKTSDILASARYNPNDHNQYHLFTRSNPSTSQPIPLGADNILKASNFVANKKTVFLVHGWRNTPQSNFNVVLVNAYLIAEDVNLIMVDWSVGAGVAYLTALNNAIRSGEHVATYITWLNLVSGASLTNYHIIGHSLGGHQAGIIGRHLEGRLAYISALDPALPGWITNPASFRSTDGLYTEVIHTDAGYSGLVTAVGDVDFYPNGGSNMPGCPDNNCSHHRCMNVDEAKGVCKNRNRWCSVVSAYPHGKKACVFYMAESLTNGGFTGRRCVSLTSALSGNCNSTETLKMGGVTSKPGSSGLYFVATNANSPFSQG